MEEKIKLNNLLHFKMNNLVPWTLSIFNVDTAKLAIQTNQNVKTSIIIQRFICWLSFNILCLNYDSAMRMF